MVCWNPVFYGAAEPGTWSQDVTSSVTYDERGY